MLVETVGQRVSRLRQARGLGLRELARVTGLHHSRISRIEAGLTVKVAGAVVATLADALGTSSTYLLTGAEPWPRESYPPEDRALFEEIERLDEPARSEVRAQAIKLAKERREKEWMRRRIDELEQRDAVG
jgi:transcriptional regulator with XRE-family HTH domain